MSTLSSYHISLKSAERDLANQESKYLGELKKEAELNKSILQIESSITKNTSLSSIASKQSEIKRKRDSLLAVQKKKVDIQKEIARAKEKISGIRAKIAAEEKKIREKEAGENKWSLKEQQEALKRLARELEEQKTINQQLGAQKIQSFAKGNQNVQSLGEFDIFISYASEDKSYVRPLKNGLEEKGVKVWLDDTELELGDSVRRGIDQGLANSRFGLLILSKPFLEKYWTNYELNGLFAKESFGAGKILPIWHDVSKDLILQYSPSLIDKVALKTSDYTMDEIIEKIAKVVFQS